MTATTEYTSRDDGSRTDRLPNRSAEYRGAKAYRRRYAELQPDADHLKPLWRELNEFLHPWSGRYLFSESKAMENIRRGERIHNSVSFEVLRTAAAGLHGGLTSPARPWFEVSHPDEKLMENREVKGWMHHVQTTMRSVLQKSNFYPIIHHLYYEALTYGQGVAIIDPHPYKGVQCRLLTCGEYVMANGADLDVNTLYRRLSMTAAQLREQFGAKNSGFSRTVEDALRQGRLSDSFEVVHAMQPVGMFGEPMHPIFKYESVYYLDQCGDPDNQPILGWYGHRSKPFVAVRWDTISDSAYGFSPGMMALADVRQLQTQELNECDGIEKEINPPMIAPSSMKPLINGGKLKPGQWVYEPTTGTANGGIRPAYQVRLDLQKSRLKIQDVTSRIRSTFFDDLFRAFLFNQKQMTATEAAQRMEEKAMILGPVLERFQAELFDAILDRVFCILFYEFEAIEPPPQIIQGDNLKIEYVGLLAQAQHQIGLTGTMNFIQSVIPIIQVPQWQGAAIKVNAKEIIDQLASANNLVPEATLTDEECDEIEAAQAKAQQEAAAMEQMKGMADVAKTAADTPLDNGSLLTGAEGGLGDGAI
ncbi:MAG: portal protein [Planctomycetaceae bacterium]|nr:portal protein [Planctomycetaceae bacterium]